ncbi:isoprenoid synthase domain-containing protein [Cyathus striatus]|nr:isoprenoid synthase domain-containing protein [Cyathus striatus]
MPTATATQFILPDLISSCPLKDAINPHFDIVARETRLWIDSYKIMSDRKRDQYSSGKIEALCSHAYPFACREEFKTICYWVNLLFIIDEISDRQTGKGARVTGDIVVKVLEDPKWDDGSPLSGMVKDFSERFIPNAGENTQSRFISFMKTYRNAFSFEAELRQEDKILDMASFIQLRKDDSAVPGCLALVEYALGYNFPHEVWEHEIFQAACEAVVEYVSFANDIYSYDMEQSGNIAGLNIVTVLMHENNIPLQEAMDRAGIYVNKQLKIYLEAKSRMPSLGFSQDACHFIEAIGHWMIGSIEWSLEGQRYFGPRHLDVKHTRIVTLTPRRQLGEF